MTQTRIAAGALALICLAATLCGAQPVEKKLIAVGWDMPNAERLRANYELMDQLPFRGTSMRFTGRGNVPFLDFAHGTDLWKPEDLAQIAEDLAAAQPQRLTHCFLDLKATPGDVDWFDDDGWAIIVDHWRQAARVAQQGGIAGILFDPESYANAQFGYREQPQADQHTYEEYCRMVRQRGGEVMAAVTEEYPDITVFSLFMLSLLGPQIEQPWVLASHRYGLYPAFVDGWLDTVGPDVTLVDGCESAYRYNSNEEHLDAANLIRNTCQRLISPENRARYRAQVQVSFGLYLDAYVNPPDSNWYIDPGEQTPLQRLEDNLVSALNAADEYVWLYGEQASWWPSPHPTADKVRWEELLPGVTSMLWSVIEPTAYAARLMDDAEQRTNLLTNGDFSSGRGGAAPEGTTAEDWTTEGAPSAWSFWQSAAAQSEGSPGWDAEVGRTAPGSATMRAVRSGCLIQSAEVTAGRRYAIAAWYRQQGEGVASVRARWHTPEGKWHAQHLDRFLAPHGTDGEWQRMIGVVRVPEGAGHLVLLLNSDGAQTEDDVLWWDDVVVSEIE